MEVRSSLTLSQSLSLLIFLPPLRCQSSPHKCCRQSSVSRKGRDTCHKHIELFQARRHFQRNSQTRSGLHTPRRRVRSLLPDCLSFPCCRFCCFFCRLCTLAPRNFGLLRKECSDLPECHHLNLRDLILSKGCVSFFVRPERIVVESRDAQLLQDAQPDLQIKAFADNKAQ